MILAHWHKLRQTQFTPPDSEAPTVPSGLSTSNITETSITLNWSASTDNVGVTGYDLRLNGSGSAGTTTNTSFTFTGLTANTSYTLEVRAKDAAGNTSNYAPITQSTASTVIITFVTSAGYSTTSLSSHTLTGLQSGDIVICQQSADTGSPDLYTGFTNINISTSSSVKARLSYIFSTGSSVTINGTDVEAVILTAFRGVDQTTPLDVTSTGNEQQDANSLTPSSITTINNGCMILACIAIDDSDKTDATTPTGYTTATAIFSNGADNSTGIVTYKKQNSAGTESPSAFSWGGNDEDASSRTIALRPE